MVVVPRLNEAPPRAILVFPLVMVEAPREVVFRPRAMKELPMAILVFPLLMVVLPSERAVLPSVMLVLPIGEPVMTVLVLEVVGVVLILAVWTQVSRQSLGLSRRVGASHTHAELAVLLLSPPGLWNGEWLAAGSGAGFYGWMVAAPVVT